MKTAVEWLYEQMPKKIQPHYKKQLEQAKEMFEKQIVNAHYQGYRPSIGTTEISEKYFNETFKTE